MVFEPSKGLDLRSRIGHRWSIKTSSRRLHLWLQQIRPCITLQCKCPVCTSDGSFSLPPHCLVFVLAEEHTGPFRCPLNFGGMKIGLVKGSIGRVTLILTPRAAACTQNCWNHTKGMVIRASVRWKYGARINAGYGVHTVTRRSRIKEIH